MYQPNQSVLKKMNRTKLIYFTNNVQKNYVITNFIVKPLKSIVYGLGEY
jgi:hypothetical protein